MNLNTYKQLILQSSLIDTTENPQLVELNKNADMEPFEGITAALSYFNFDYRDIDLNDNKTLYNALTFLDCKISSARKTATFWDAYAIKSTVTSRDNFLKEYGKLANNTSLLIDSNEFQVGSKSYKRGDIVCKNNEGQEIHVSSAQQGYYKPTTLTITSGTTCLLTFNYFSGTPSAADASVETDGLVTDDGIMYNIDIQIAANDSATIDYIKEDDGTIIKPVWEIRVVNSDCIYGAATITYDTTTEQITIKNNTPFALHVLGK